MFLPTAAEKDDFDSVFQLCLPIRKVQCQPRWFFFLWSRAHLFRAFSVAWSAGGLVAPFNKYCYIPLRDRGGKGDIYFVFQLFPKVYVPTIMHRRVFSRMVLNMPSSESDRIKSAAEPISSFFVGPHVGWWRTSRKYCYTRCFLRR